MSRTNGQYDLAPAARKRTAAAPQPAAGAPVAAATPVDVHERLAAVERAVHAIDVRTASMERLVTTAVERLESAVESLAARIEATDLGDLQAEVRLVGERLGMLLGGPSLTELMDRVDELGRTTQDETPKRQRRRTTALLSKPAGT